MAALLLFPLALFIATGCLTLDESLDDSAVTTPTTSAAVNDNVGDDVDDDIDDDVDDDTGSTGLVSVAGRDYSFDVTCYDVGAGEVLALGSGSDDSGPTELYVRSFLGEPYIGLRLSNGTLVESTLDAPLELFLQDDVIRASALRLATGLDLETGQSSELGFGTVEVACNSYKTGWFR